MRDAESHATAAYLASINQSGERCGRIGPEFDFTDADGRFKLERCRSDFNVRVLEGGRIEASVEPGSQSIYWKKLDAGRKMGLIGDTTGDGFFGAHIKLCLPSAGACLTAPLEDHGREMKV